LRTRPTPALAAALLAGLLALAAPAHDAAAQRARGGRGGHSAHAGPVVRDQARYDPVFRKYSKRFFGPTFDWQYFKAQGQAESDLVPTARSRVGARGVMQLMPGTYNLIKRNRREWMGSIEDPEWNIAAAIMHERSLWLSLDNHPDDEDRLRFMFGSYNAGEGPILRARNVARAERLDDRAWSNIERVAPKVSGWRYTETLPYVRKIEDNHRQLASEPRKVNAAAPKRRGGS